MHRAVALAIFFAVAGSAWADNYLVLPFFNQSKDKSLDWIGDSLAEAVREALASEGLIALERQDRNDPEDPVYFVGEGNDLCQEDRR